jgi:ferredoxin-thioredoxin reductase catalytic subunit
MSSGGETPSISPEEVERLFNRLTKEAESAGYHLNPDTEFTKGLVEGLLVNEVRYGYWACPCRLASGSKTQDLDIICPCDYRDPNLTDYDACYCALYVSQDVVDGKKKARRIPERRPEELSSAAGAGGNAAGGGTGAAGRTGKAGSPDKTSPGSAGPGAGSLEGLGFPVWRCKVCGYLCARASPPEVCPICRAKKERFEKFL